LQRVLDKVAVRRAVFLDRDGVINRSLLRGGRPYAPTSLADFEILPGVAESLLELRQQGFLNIVVTNQPDIKTGAQSLEVLQEMNRRLFDILAIDAIQMCVHTDEDDCACRKPRPGMLQDAARTFKIDLEASWMIGDRWRDIAAGQAAGCHCLFIDYGYAERQPEPPFRSVESLLAAVSLIVEQSKLQSKGEV
jgi:D-glycero-D-manno-heptose 1,7-bisphosphate phosphatase